MLDEINNLNDFCNHISDEFPDLSYYDIKHYIKDEKEHNSKHDNYKYTADLVVEIPNTDIKFCYEIGYDEKEDNVYFIHEGYSTHEFDESELNRCILIDALDIIRNHNIKTSNI